MSLQTVKTLPRAHADDCLLSEREASRLLGVSPAWLARDRWHGPSIPFVKIGKQVRYRRADLLDYIGRHVVAADDTP